MNEYDEIDAHRDRLLELRSGSVIGPVHIEIDGQEGFRYFPELLPNYRARKRRILLRAKEILEDLHPMTVRQVYYRLVVEGLVENSRNGANDVVQIMKKARRSLFIPFDWIEDRIRRPIEPIAYNDPKTALDELAERYRLDVWKDQPKYFEIWTEKGAFPQ